MSRLYANPIRVYLLLGFIAVVGIYCGLTLPVSLFPNSSKPEIYVGLSYGNSTAEEFLHTHGAALESQIKRIEGEGVTVEKVVATYDAQRVSYNVIFHWGVDPNAAKRETERVVNAFVARLPQESRDSLTLWLNNENTGFFALSFYSETRDLNALYDYLEPLLGPRIAQVADAQEPVLWNPSRNEIRIELNPESMAALGLFPRNIQTALDATLGAYGGGSVTVGNNILQIEMPRSMKGVDELALVPVLTPSGKEVHLGDVARIDLGPKTMDTTSFKTSGAPSLILFATPKPGGNVKKMSEDLLGVVEELSPEFPPDVKHRVLVDPSEFIRSAVKNVFFEVGLAALLAVLVLFVFIGSFRNVVTAAIEIPLSMVLAFILMKLTGMNLNLISLGGLALAAGMNVDASVVVMENIFRHFEMSPGRHDFQSRLRIITQAVREVRFPILASTVASLVVFLPLTFTSDLSYAILGDLAKAVVFSHGFSAFVAILLVPTIRLQLMARETGGPHRSLLERPLRWLEENYSRALGGFLGLPLLKWAAYGGLGVLLAVLALVILPRLPKEVIGTPDTDWMMLGVNTEGNTLIRQMEMQAQAVERELFDKFGDRISYTFNQIRHTNRAMIMARLKNKEEMQTLWKEMEAHFTNTPFLRYWVAPWNPSELPIPDPPHMQLAVRASQLPAAADAAREINDLLEANHAFDRLRAEPDVSLQKGIFLRPHLEQWEALGREGHRFAAADLADVLRVATVGRRAGLFPSGGRELTEIILRYPPNAVDSVETIESFPLGIGPKIVPLKALATVSVRESPPIIHRENLREVFFIKGRQNRGQEGTKDAALAGAKLLVDKWEKSEAGAKAREKGVSVAFEDPARDVNEAISQLGTAVGLSVLLIFITMLVQFGSFVEPLLVLVSVPLGFIGVLASLYVFKSTVSLNAALGVILLNGIAVANSIILVDFIKRLVAGGLSPREAALEAARKRLRPILITSLTTILGMLPIALGSGEGGHILQPLGIAVTGGLWVSTLLTLFLVPALHVSYLEWSTGAERARTRVVWEPAVLLFLLGPAAVGAESLSFTKAMNRIVERSVTVEKARATLEGTRSRYLSQGILLWVPTVRVEGKYGSNRVDSLSTTGRSVEAVADLNLFRFGADLGAYRAASREIESLEFALANAYLGSEAEGVSALVAYVQAVRQVEVARRIEEARRESLGIARRRFDRGMMAVEEVDKVSIDLDNATAQLRDAEQELAQAAASLRALAGDVEVEAEWPWQGILTKTAPRLLPVDKPDLASRPDWRAAEEAVGSADARASEAFGNIFPRLDARVGYGVFENTTLGLRDRDPTLTAGLVLTIPLFDRLERYGSYRAKLQDRAFAEAELENTRRNARRDWEGAKASLAISRDTALAREKTLTTSRRLFQANLRRFNQGVISANELRVDQDRLYQSELNVIRGWGSAHSDFRRLCHAVGWRMERCLGEIEKRRR